MVRANRLAALLALVLLPAGLAYAPTAAAGPDAACDLGFTEPTHDRYLARGEDAVVVDFTLDAPISDWFYYAAAFAWAQPVAGGPETREGGIVGRILVDAQGEVLDHAAGRLFPSSLAVSAGGDTLQLSPEPSDGCGWLASGGLLDLAPGSYRMVVLGAMEHGSERGALLPKSITDVEVTTVPARALGLSARSCQTYVDIETPMQQAAYASGCEDLMKVPSGKRGFWIHYAPKHPEGQMQDVAWRSPDGSSTRVSGFLVGTGGSGNYYLEATTWTAVSNVGPVTPPTSPFVEDDDVVGVAAAIAP